MIRRSLILAILLLVGLASASAFAADAPAVRSFVDEARAPGYAASPMRAGAAGKLAITAQLDSGWQRFRSSAGGNWSVQWNADTQTPGLAVGKPFAINGFAKLGAQNIESACRSFIQANKSLFKVDSSSLRMAASGKDGGRWRVSFQQLCNGVPVLGGSVRMSFTKDDRVVMFGSSAYPGVSTNTVPALDAKQAAEIASKDAGKPGRSSDPELCVLPTKLATGYGYSLCWRVQVATPSAQRKLEYLIDAHTGRVLRKWDALWYDISGAATGDYKPEYASDPTQVSGFAHETVIAEPPEAVLASWNMDTDPGWTLEGQWAYGVPTGAGSQNLDPVSGYTGANVVGYNLSGDYPNNMPTTYYAKTPAVDCSGYANTKLRFRRWLGVESSNYDHATVQVSSDDANWTTIWSNGTSSMGDTSWVLQEFDISALADGRPTVYVRWGMGPTDLSVTYPGWNIDDVEVISLLGVPASAYTSASGAYSLTAPSDPCVVRTNLRGQYCAVMPDSGTASIFEQEGVGPDDTVNVVWDSSRYARIVEPNAYWHVNHVHDYYSALDPGFTGLDYAVPITVSVAGYDNAYWDGNGITLGQGDGVNYDDFGLYSEIIYHEYTHGVTDKIYTGIDFPYAMEPGAMNEGWSDYFGCRLSLSQGPLVGDGGIVIGQPSGFRTLENTYRRETDFNNEVHDDSQMFSGSLWEARQSLGTTMDELVHFARYDHPTTFEQTLTAIILEDDARFGDSDPSNGSLNGEAIFTGFGNHGIGGLQCLPGDIRIDDLTGNANGKIDPGETVGVSVTLTDGWANATDVTATLSCSDPFVQVQKGSAAFPDANYGATTNNDSDLFVISVAPNCPETHTINFSLQINASGPYAYSRNCLLYQNVAVGQMAYDDDGADANMNWGSAGGGLAVRFTPDSYPCYPTAIRLKMNGSGTVPLQIWDDNGTGGAPGTVLGTAGATVAQAGQWLDVDISSLKLKIADGSFYVGWIEQQNSSPFYCGMDFDPPYSGRSWVFDGSQWTTLESFGWLVNNMVRVRWSTKVPVAAAVIGSWNFDTDPGWVMQGEWQFGTPTGLGGNMHGNPDPTGGHTGSNVCGVNLNGDYSTTIGGPWYLTTGPVDCSGYSNVKLAFSRWLNTDYQGYVYATVDVSNDGAQWTNIWNNGDMEIADSAWAQYTYPIESVADNQPTVYIRWGYQVNGDAYAYSGWNIDDVVVSGKPSPGSISAAKRRGNGQSVLCGYLPEVSDIVTAVFADCFYIESADRTAGIRIEGQSSGLQVGDRVDVIGTVSTNMDQERRISATEVDYVGTGSVQPVGMSNARLGGGDWDYAPASGRGQAGITGSSGLNNIGLLVKAWGRVTIRGREWFYMDDGSGVSDGTGFMGIFVQTPGVKPPAQGSWVTVTGISSCQSYDGRQVNVLLARSALDIQTSDQPTLLAAGHARDIPNPRTGK